MSVSIETIKARFGIIGHDSRLIKAIEVAYQVAPTDVTVLIQGENGTGKDVFHKIIHAYSKRKHQPAIAINCGAIPEGTMDSELFGHEKGAFTSAYENRKGYFEEVDGGLIFLDEIAEMPLSTQAKLLRLLESGEYLRVGSSKVRTTDVRIVAATNKNLIEMIRQGKFREDLYFRLNTVSIVVPPLRERGADIELLFRYFANEFADKYNRIPLALTTEAEDLLMSYRWPGNVRELRNFVEKLTVLEEGEDIDEETIRKNLNLKDIYLPSVVQRQHNFETEENQSAQIELLYKLIFELRKEMGELKKMMYMGVQPETFKEERAYLNTMQAEEIMFTPPISHKMNNGDEKPQILLEESLSLEKKEKELISKALEKFQNNRKRAAKELGISERTLYRKIKQYELS